jgi:hypothetical protein
MSNDADVLCIKKQRTIHYGTLEEQERARLSTAAVKSGDSDEVGSSSIMGQQIQDSGNISISDGEYCHFVYSSCYLGEGALVHEQILSFLLWSKSGLCECMLYQKSHNLLKKYKYNSVNKIMLSGVSWPLTC